MREVKIFGETYEVIEQEIIDNVVEKIGRDKALPATDLDLALVLPSLKMLDALLATLLEVCFVLAILSPPHFIITQKNVEKIIYKIK